MAQQQNQGQGQMGNLLLPLVAAVGAGAATFYTMTRQSGQGQNMPQQTNQFAQEINNQKDQYQ